ncbi:unnamed protein product [Rotaria sordida]|uniref:Ion transport domain-containing protein n=1 Tax=Rotaria sordida TaxID=392033 RepID=A0A815ERR8_9BILA|nr:unnamed protein product [Rotaria sordida]
MRKYSKYNCSQQWIIYIYNINIFSFLIQSFTGYSGYHLDIDKELFLWSVITGKREFNLLFWSRGKNKVCAALIAALVYRKRARKDHDSRYHQTADEFENLAVQILDRFYQINSRACIKAVIRQIPSYGNVTWLELAIKAEAKQFIAQRAVQDVLNNIWYGYIDQKETERKIIFSTIMLWYSGFLRYHDELVKTSDPTRFIDELLSKANLRQQSQTIKSLHSMDKPTDDIQMRLMHGVASVDNTPVDFIAVGFCEKANNQISQYFKNILKFLRAPYVKYLYNLYFHVIFLSLFSYMILSDFFPLYEFQSDVCGPNSPPERQEDGSNNSSLIKDNEINTNITVPYGFQKHDRPSTSEYILFIWVTTLLCEEIRQFFSLEAKSIRNAVVAYFEVFWNKLDVLAIILFYVGFILRFLPYTECFCAARIVFSVDITIWFIRSLDLFAAIKRLGPKLVMIGEMMHDLKFYMIMLVVFIMGFGVSSYSLIYGAKAFTWHLPREIINLAYWQIFGELNALDSFEHNYRPNGYAVFILLVIYMAIVNILLVNLLIAMFSNTFDRLQTDTDRIWKFQRYSLICEYLSRPSIPPPFILFSHLWRFALYTLTSCSKSSWLRETYIQHTSRNKYEIMLDEKSACNIEIAEDALGDEIYYNYIKIGRKLAEEQDLDEERIHSPQETTLSKMRLIENRVQIIRNQQAHVLDYLDCLMDGLKTLGGERIRVPDRRRYDPDESFDETITPTDQPRQDIRRESLMEAIHRTSITPEYAHSSMTNLFESRKNE